MSDQKPSLHNTQVLLSLITMRFFMLGRLFRLWVITLEGDKNLVSESVLRLVSLKSCMQQKLLDRNEDPQICL